MDRILWESYTTRNNTALINIGLHANTESGDIILSKELSVARGKEKAELVLKNASIVNVFTEAIEVADVAICNGRIAGIGVYEGETELNCSGKYVAPGFLDGHIHLESSMMKPVEFAKAVLPHGTTAVITDPHEITNVCGVSGMEYMLRATKGLPLDVYFTVPSCVPSTSFDENGCELRAADMEDFYHHERVIGLAEVMDYYGTIMGDPEILQKITGAKHHGKIVDGHAPGLRGKEACAYVFTGIGSDHECVSLEEALEKLRLGEWIMIREGTAARNLESLMGLFNAPYHQRAMLVTDDKHPYDLREYGHMDSILRKAVKLGADPCIAIKMATLNTATYFGLKERGAIAPGYLADLVILSDLQEMKVEKVFKDGSLVAAEDQLIDIKEPELDNDILSQVYNSFHCSKLSPEDFAITADQKPVGAESFRVIRFIKGEIGTNEIRVPLTEELPKISTGKDILKIAAIERYHNTGHIGLGFVNGYGLKRGAIASSVAHDAHNIIVIGTNDTDMAAAANCIRDMQGGWAIALEGKIITELPLSIAGLMSDLEAKPLADRIEELVRTARDLGVEEGIDPFLTLAFVSLPVIPELRLITTGLFDVGNQKPVSIFI